MCFYDGGNPVSIHGAINVASHAPQRINARLMELVHGLDRSHGFDKGRRRYELPMAPRIDFEWGEAIRTMNEQKPSHRFTLREEKTLSKSGVIGQLDFWTILSNVNDRKRFRLWEHSQKGFNWNSRRCLYFDVVPTRKPIWHRNIIEIPILLAQRVKNGSVITAENTTYSRQGPTGLGFYGSHTTRANFDNASRLAAAEDIDKRDLGSSADALNDHADASRNIDHFPLPGTTF